jgi:5-methylcytosine-specific restriction endonuclease McrA
MKSLRQKRPRLVLKHEDYGELRNRVLDRDGWKCQGCGSSVNLQVHHFVRRSQLGSDVLENLITLCVDCHRRQHNMAQASVGKNAASRSAAMTLQEGG